MIEVGIIMNGVTGRMGTNQHLIRSIAAIIANGGLKLNDKESIMPVPVLVGRNEAKLQQLAQRTGISNYTTDLDSVLQDKTYSIYFDAQTTGRREAAVKQAVKAETYLLRKDCRHYYCRRTGALSSL